MAVCVYGFWDNYRGRPIGELEQRHAQVIMYSLTTCGYCVLKAKELHKENIDFIEYYIDENQELEQELNNKMAEAGYKPRAFGTPVLDVNGMMLPDNPPIEKIRGNMVY